MVNTRNQHASANNENNAANLPPPPTLEQVLLMQAQILQTMQQTMANMHQGQGHQQAPQPHPHDKLGESQRTKPPTFSHSIEPMDADEWLKTIERNFKSCNTTTERWFCSPHTSSRDLHLTGGMRMLMHMRGPTT
jgi:hypothetical protein